MAKNKYTVTEAVDIVGTLDYNQSEDLVVYVEVGRGDNIITREIDVIDVLRQCGGRQISLKLTNEEDKCDEQ